MTKHGLIVSKLVTYAFLSINTDIQIIICYFLQVRKFLKIPAIMLKELFIVVILAVLTQAVTVSITLVDVQ